MATPGSPRPLLTPWPGTHPASASIGHHHHVRSSKYRRCAGHRHGARGPLPDLPAGTPGPARGRCRFAAGTGRAVPCALCRQADPRHSGPADGLGAAAVRQSVPADPAPVPRTALRAGGAGAASLAGGRRATRLRADDPDGSVPSRPGRGAGGGCRRLPAPPAGPAGGRTVARHADLRGAHAGRALCRPACGRDGGRQRGHRPVSGTGGGRCGQRQPGASPCPFQPLHHGCGAGAGHRGADRRRPCPAGGWPAGATGGRD